eukprot:TRINITY_DN1385_c0_g1_i3.p1 TRINITY_DN1385_c0_g1~~TRINITY_DN1385_c0_g1_i3.p1  ORF type:complete len:315 (+),score=52.85 TRINITY_DN1385_c0_g1_i3:46-990(+)
MSKIAEKRSPTYYLCFGCAAICVIASLVAIATAISVYNYVAGIRTSFDSKISNAGGDYRQAALQYFLDSGRFDDLKVVLNSAVKGLERVQVVDVATNRLMKIQIDVSNDGEYAYLLSFMARSNKFPKHRIIVDIGAFDGLMSSNSFNFIQLGWDGLIVEPSPELMAKAKSHLERFATGWQTVEFAQVAVSDSDGEAYLNQFEGTGLENSLLNTSMGMKAPNNAILVKTRRINTLLEEHKIPLDFGILSIDAEGLGYQITHSLLETQFRPRFIISELLGDNLETMDKELAAAGYSRLGATGMNGIWVFDPEMARY